MNNYLQECQQQLRNGHCGSSPLAQRNTKQPRIHSDRGRIVRRAWQGSVGTAADVVTMYSRQDEQWLPPSWPRSAPSLHTTSRFSWHTIKLNAKITTPSSTPGQRHPFPPLPPPTEALYRRSRSNRKANVSLARHTTLTKHSTLAHRTLLTMYICVRHPASHESLRLTSPSALRGSHARGSSQWYLVVTTTPHPRNTSEPRSGVLATT